MRINPINTTCTFRSNNTKTKSSHNPTYPKPKKQLTTVEKAGIGIFSAILLGAAIIELKKPPRKSFEKMLKKNGLEFRENILVKKETGEKFTGELKRSTGKPDKFKHREMIETQRFENGIRTERTYTDVFNREIEGFFYKDGELKLEVFAVIESGEKRFGFYPYKNGQIVLFGDGYMKKDESVFEWARDYVKNNRYKK